MFYDVLMIYDVPVFFGQRGTYFWEICSTPFVLYVYYILYSTCVLYDECMRHFKKKRKKRGLP